MTITKDALRKGLTYLALRDGDLAEVLRTIGPPPLWTIRPGFPTLVRIILGQQVSLASARAVFVQLQTSVSKLTPAAFLRLDGAALRRIGFSRQKVEYCRSLAEAIVKGRLELKKLAQLEDTAVRLDLTQQKGIGGWTADIYLLMALRRPDVWPSGDLALVKATQQVKRLGKPPSADELIAIASTWRPWRAVAARLLWHRYLNPEKQSP